MKNKSARHKDENTFKFQPFSERISNIDVDIFHRVVHENEADSEEIECSFYQNLEKWEVLNLSESYSHFQREIRAHSLISLPQLLHEQNRVVESLIKHLEVKNVLSLQPILDHVVALAKDLRIEFYNYYPKFLSVLLNLLNTKDTDQLEWTFTCLAYIFKLLWRPLIKDINTVFVDLLPLLSDNKPDYINNFAAESFAFVARKVKDKQNFLSLILKTVETQQNGIKGCGQLIFEVLNGVNGQFHSCAEILLPFLIDSLLDKKLPQNTLFEILQQIVENITSKIHPQKNELFWNTCEKSLENFIDLHSKKSTEKCSNNINLLLVLIGYAIEFKEGKLVKNPVKIIQLLIKIINTKNINEETLQSTVKIALLLLLSENIKLPQEFSCSLTAKLLTIENKKVLLYFFENSNETPVFKALILPTFLKFCVKEQLDLDTLYVLTKLLIKKSPVCFDGIKLSKWKKYPINFGSDENNLIITNLLTKMITFNNREDLINKLNNYICATICLSHLQNIEMQKTTTIEILQINCKKFGGYLKEVTITEVNRKEILFLTNCTLECLIHLIEDNVEIIKGIGEIFVDILLPLCSDINYLSALKSLDLILTNSKENVEIVNMESLMKIHKVLEGNFSSPFSEIRLLTSHIYTLFEPILNTTLNNPQISEQFSIFSICYQTESITPQVDTYRSMTNLLEKFTGHKTQIQLAKTTDFHQIPLRYLCGILYINFTLLWKPVQEIISTQSEELSGQIFWEVFGKELRKAVDNIRNPVKFEPGNLSSDVEFLGELYLDFYKVESKPDFMNYRLLLWKSMESFASVAEAKTRDISDLLLKFFEEEYTRVNSDVATFWNIKQKVADETLDDTEIDIADLSDNEETEDTEEIPLKVSRKNKTGGQSGGKMILKTLLQHLTLFTKIRSPKSMFREPELYKLYLDLLSHKNHEVQQLSLNCLSNYHLNYLTPYLPHLTELINEKTSRNKFATFRIDTESNSITEEHRDGLVPLVLRLVFSKMIAKTGQRTGGKNQNRRNLVLRFLSGCKDVEMLGFVRMSFKYYTKFLDIENPEEMIETICETVDLEKIVPPKRLISAMNLLNVIFDSGGLLNDEILKHLLKVLLVISGLLKGIYDRKEFIHAGYLASLKTLKNLCLKTTEQFFEHYYNYPWTCQEINAVFKVAIWPYLDKLNIEGIHSPSRFLKLVVVWGSNPRYFALLNKQNPAASNDYILPHVMQLLVNEKSRGTVTNLIMEMIEKLVKLQVDVTESVIVVDDVKPISDELTQKLNCNETLNYGSCILLPHVNFILEKFHRKLQSKAKNINPRELFILSRISELVTASDISDSLLELLLPVCQKKCSLNPNETSSLQLITTINNLMQNSGKPEKHLRNVSSLFGVVRFPAARKVLCEILAKIAETSDDTLKETLQTSANLIAELNAYDPKWVEQPDFERRLDAFKQVKTILEEDRIPLELGILMIYNCYYLITIEKDLSLKDSASHCIKTIAPKLVKKYPSAKDVKYIVDETLFTLIRAGFKQPNDVRNECISILGHLARNCPENHIILYDLHKISNSVDLEVDFFENLVHLQAHRHGRALLKFGQIYKEENNPPNSRSLTQFILPLTTHYLCNEKYATKHSLIDSAIETIGVICKLLPWHQYEGLLKYYLGKLKHKVEFQRQIIRLVVVILDSFHFDLSKGHVLENALLLESTIVETENKDKEPKDEEITDDKDNEEELDVDESLDNIELTLEIEEEIPADKTLKAIERITTLCKSSSCRVIKTIRTILLPQLHRTLAEMTSFEGAHKVNRKITSVQREEEDMLRIPISLALVKLLQKLPKAILDSNFPGVLMKLCSFFKSPLESVRRTARDILLKIMTALGPDYLQVMLDSISPLLSRGFQSHVLVYTVHSVLNALKDNFKKGDLDLILGTVSKLCQADLFGELSEEKEIVKIGAKTSEAKSTKSFDTYQILAQYLTDKCLMDLILPLKDVLLRTHSFKTVTKVQTCLRNISLGLVENAFITAEVLVTFAYGVAAECIPQLVPEVKEISEKERVKQERFKESCLIIAKSPKRQSSSRQNVKVAKGMNSYVLVEFGLRLCHVLLKRDKFRDGGDFRPFLDPFVPVFVKCLASNHVKLGTATIQCLGWIIKYDLPAMKENIDEIINAMFAILHKYAAAGLSKGDNFDLVVATFKTMSTFVRHTTYHPLTPTQHTLLLMYAEQDLHNDTTDISSTTTFTLLRALLHRLTILSSTTPPPVTLHETMTKVAQLSVTSSRGYVRVQARGVVLEYLVAYPVGEKKLGEMVGWYLAQVGYEGAGGSGAEGRGAVMEVLGGLVQAMPQHILKKHSGTFLITLGARLINEETPDVKKAVANCITAMFKKLEKANVDELFDIIMIWFQDEKITTRQLAAQISGLLINAEKSNFECRLATITPIILKHLGIRSTLKQRPGRLVSLKPRKINEDYENVRVNDHYLYQLLQTLQKLALNCPQFLKNSENTKKISVQVQSLLGHPHEWVRLASAQFLGYVLAQINVDKLVEGLNSNVGVENGGYLLENPREDVKSLTLDLCEQLTPGEIKSEFAEQVVKNLVFLARVLQYVPKGKEKIDKTSLKVDNEESSNETDEELSKTVETIVKVVKTKENSDESSTESLTEHQTPLKTTSVKKKLKNYVKTSPNNNLDTKQELLGYKIQEQLTKIFKTSPAEKPAIDDDLDEPPTNQINLLFLVKRMRKIVNTEIVQTPTITTLRSQVFQWIAGVCTALELPNILRVLHHLVAPLVRELATVIELDLEEDNLKTALTSLRHLARDVAKIVKRRVGMEVFTRTTAKLQQLLTVRRAERKRQRVQLAVAEPELYARKKIKRHEKKREAKKRKVGERKEGKGFKGKKRRVLSVEDNSDVM